MFTITNTFFIQLVVHDFDVKDAQGKKVHICDQFETRIDSDDVLKFLMKSQPENLILTVEFIEIDLSSYSFTVKVCGLYNSKKYQTILFTENTIGCRRVLDAKWWK